LTTASTFIMVMSPSINSIRDHTSPAGAWGVCFAVMPSSPTINRLEPHEIQANCRHTGGTVERLRLAVQDAKSLTTRRLRGIGGPLTVPLGGISRFWIALSVPVTLP